MSIQEINLKWAVKLENKITDRHCLNSIQNFLIMHYWLKIWNLDSKILLDFISNSATSSFNFTEKFSSHMTRITKLQSGFLVNIEYLRLSLDFPQRNKVLKETRMKKNLSALVSFNDMEVIVNWNSKLSKCAIHCFLLHLQKTLRHA